jgi:hypothetical protein
MRLTVCAGLANVGRVHIRPWTSMPTDPYILPSLEVQASVPQKEVVSDPQLHQGGTHSQQDTIHN